MMTEIQHYDPYPDETLLKRCPKSAIFKIPRIWDEKIVGEVAQLRKKSQKKRRGPYNEGEQFILKEGNDHLLPDPYTLGFTYEEVKNWRFLGSNKAQILKWFTRNEIL